MLCVSVIVKPQHLGGPGPGAVASWGKMKYVFLHKLFVYPFQIEFVEYILSKFPRIHFTVIRPKGENLLLFLL